MSEELQDQPESASSGSSNSGTPVVETVKQGLEDQLRKLTEKIPSYQKKKSKLLKKIDDIKRRIPTLDTEIRNREARLQSLETEITNQSNKRDTILKEIAFNASEKNTLESEIVKLQETVESEENKIEAAKEKQTEVNGKIGEAKEEIKKLTDDKNKLVVDIVGLQTEKEKIQENVKIWRDRSELYSKDLEGLFKDNKSQRQKYIIGAITCLLSAVTVLWITIKFLKTPIVIPEQIEKLFAQSPGLVFSFVALMRLSFVGLMIYVVLLAVNLFRGFVAQLIRTNEKMAGIRLLDFSVSSIGKESVPGMNEEELFKYETDKLTRQNILLNQRLPDLIEYRTSSFDKISETKNPVEGVAGLIKSQGEETGQIKA